MKKLLIIFLLLGLTVPAIALESWPRGSLPSKEQTEYNAIMLKVAAINEQFSGVALSSPSRNQAIINLLKTIGTPVSYKIYKELYPQETRNETKTQTIVNDQVDSRPLVLAILLKKNNEVNELLNLGVNPNICYLGQQLVKHAVKLGNIEGAKLLVKYGADFSGQMNVEKRARQFGDENVLTYIFHNFNITENDVLNLLQEIVDHGFNLRGSNDLTDTWSAAIRYSKGHDATIVKFLIKNGANPNQIISFNNQVWTPLLIAVDSFNQAAVGVLLDSGADINKAGSPLWHGTQTPLSYAILKGDSAMVSFLLARGATV